MIRNQNRSRWFGASDTATIMGNWDTPTFRRWWAVKCGAYQNNISTWPMQVGNIMEHRIIDKVAKLTGRRIRKGRYPAYRRHRLRVNYDGLTRDAVIEIKTSRKGFERVPKGYWQQCQVLMYAKRRRRCELWLYMLTEEDYRAPYYATIDPDRLRCFVIEYDRDWAETEYLPRLRCMAQCLRKGVFPHENCIR